MEGIEGGAVFIGDKGSITIDRNLLQASGLLPNEAVHVWDVTNEQTPVKVGAKIRATANIASKAG